MTTPGGQQPGQPQQPWGSPPPQQPWGQQPQWGAQPGYGQPQWGAPPGYGQPPGYGPPPGFGPPARKSGAGRLIGVVAGVVVLAAVAVLVLVLGGSTTPEAGDCVHTTAVNELETVECSASDADYRVLGVDDQHGDHTQAQFQGDDSTCTQFGGVTQQVWVGDLDDPDATGTIYCLGAV